MNYKLLWEHFIGIWIFLILGFIGFVLPIGGIGYLVYWVLR